MRKTKNKGQTILIVGDWVVDEYWFLVRHHSDISSHTGFFHYRLSTQRNETVSDLCSAGHVARVLYQLRPKGSNDYKLFGLGAWHRADTELIRHLVHAKANNGCAAASATYRLTPHFCNDVIKEIKLVTLRPESSTNRAIRQYHQEDGELKQINRVDWELEKSAQGPATEWSKLPLPKPDDVRAIVIHDLSKGVVTESLITKLRERYPSAVWYVRSKDTNPDWMKHIKDVIELLIIGPEVAALLNPWDTWLAQDKITIQAVDAIKTLPGKNVVLLSDRREVIGRLNGAEHCLTARSRVKPSPITQLGWPSAFFAALVHGIYDKTSGVTEQDIMTAMKHADAFAGVPVKQQDVKPDDVVTRLPIFEPWKKEATEWQQATQDCGIISRDGELQFDVWRGSTYLPGYVACIEQKRQIITRIGKNLRAFNQGETQIRSLSIMLQADPGAGKTFLAQRLAKAFGYSFLRYDVTQMIRRDELLDLFDTLATMQANEKNNTLVFVDEINALVDGGHLYGAFLAPLEDGVYVRRGKIFSLKPCVWVFAGTRLDEEDLEAGEKLSDFKSRVTMIEEIDYKSLSAKATDSERLSNEARLEQVYLGASMIGRHFSDVQQVSKEILQWFHRQDPSKEPARKIRKHAAALRNVQYGKITRINCDEDWGPWPDKEDGQQSVKLTFG
ncbi:MAG TPA: ATP-binding protein [Pyrinomonadaceae bacterium]|nr:ATP-binding protein [Pyrinomonadaceae bacterium]